MSVFIFKKTPNMVWEMETRWTTMRASNEQFVHAEAFRTVPFMTVFHVCFGTPVKILRSVDESSCYIMLSDLLSYGQRG